MPSASAPRAVGPGAPFKVKSEVAEAGNQAPRDDEHDGRRDIPLRRLTLHARLHNSKRVRILCWMLACITLTGLKHCKASTIAGLQLGSVPFAAP
jgi:hypothetical protein